MRLALSRRARGTVAVLALAGAGACAPAVTTQQEVALGADYARQINSQLPLIRDASVHNYINELGRQIARVDPRGINYTFYVVNSDVVNAFAIPGGHVYVNRGLIERTDNMSELAGVLAHEIGHVVERHGVEQMQRAQNANTTLAVLYGVLLRRQPGTLERGAVQVGGSAYFARYGREAEREADRVAVGYLMRAGISPQGLVTFFQELLSQQQRNPSAVEQWFSTHPTSQERVQNAQAVINATPGATNRNLTADSRAYQTFKSRVRAQPAAPRSPR